MIVVKWLRGQNQNWFKTVAVQRKLQISYDQYQYAPSVSSTWLCFSASLHPDLDHIRL